MRDGLSIVTTAADGHVIDAYHEVVLALRAHGLRVEHVGIASDTWYPREGRARYASYGCTTYDLPRPSGRKTPWWSTEGVMSEAADAYPALKSLIREIWMVHEPAVFMLADDQGPLEVALIRQFKALGSAVLLMEHGYGHIKQPTHGHGMHMDEIPGRARSVRRPLGRLRRGAARLLRVARAPTIPSLPPVGVFGTNGADAVCTYSELSAKRLVSAGVNPALLRPTGYPYFDQFVRRGRLPNSVRHNRRPRALVVSNGCGTYGQVLEAAVFYELALATVKELGAAFDVTFRYKANERPHTFLPESVLKRLEASSMLIDEGQSKTIDVLQDYDLVFGGESTVLLEALVLGSAPVLLDAASAAGESDQPSTLRAVLTEHLGVARVMTPRHARDVAAFAANPTYLRNLNLRLQERQGLLFHGLDGLAGKRVAAAVLEAVAGTQGDAR